MSSLRPDLSRTFTRARTHHVTELLHQILLSLASYIHGILSAIFTPILHSDIALSIRAHIDSLVSWIMSHYKPRPRHFLGVLAVAVFSLLVALLILRSAAHVTQQRVETRIEAWTTLKKIMYGGNGYLRVEGLG